MKRRSVHTEDVHLPRCLPPKKTGFSRRSLISHNKSINPVCGSLLCNRDATTGCAVLPGKKLHASTRTELVRHEKITTYCLYTKTPSHKTRTLHSSCVQHIYLAKANKVKSVYHHIFQPSERENHHYIDYVCCTRFTGPNCCVRLLQSQSQSKTRKRQPGPFTAPQPFTAIHFV